MLPWMLVDTAKVPDSGERLRLLRRGSDYSIRLDDGELMGSRMRGSEDALARLGCARIALHVAARVLVGGFGMGFTLRAALDTLGPGARVTVAELVPAVVAWGRGPLADLSGYALADPRVTVRNGDVGDLIRSSRSAFDAILLDVDNGPDGLTRPANDRLYDQDGLGAAKAALRPGGILGVWSAAPDPGFTSRLKRNGFAVDEVAVRANGSRGARHVIWLAVRPGSGP